MKELDFDELDRAVNSLMEGVPKAKPAGDKDEEETKTLTISPTLADDATPDFKALGSQDVTPAVSPSPTPTSNDTTAQPTPASEPAAQPDTTTVSAVPRTAPSLATRRGGRFMDVVHPSSDMKTSTPTPPARPVSRQGVTIEQTTAQPTPASEPATQPDAVPDKPAADTPEASVPSAPVNEWPDPLDMANFKQEAKEETSTPSQEDESGAAVGNKVDSDMLPPLSSPFLSGTKVEKRPLGSPAPSESHEPAEEPDHAPVTVDGGAQDSSVSVSDPADQLPPEPGKVEAPLPEELRSDLMAIESGSHVAQEHTEVPVESEAKKVSDEQEQKPTSVSSEPAKDAAKDTDVPTGPTSIAQQYKEEPSSGDQTSGAIYDTDTYHQPLAHPAEKKSGWMWVLWIVLILVIGAGGGAALYFLGII